MPWIEHSKKQCEIADPIANFFAVQSAKEVNQLKSDQTSEVGESHDVENTS
jgi:hypothetical protein